jgi:hypothetical protein
MLRPQLVIHAACAPVCVEAANGIERGEEMRRLAAMALCLILCGCGTSDDKPVGLEVRPLSAAEQDALRRSFSVALKEPDAAQFKWMPVLVGPKGRPTNYCGLVNGPTAAGTFSGFRKFAAAIAQNSSGAYDHGTIQHVEGAPAIFEASAGIGDQSAAGNTVELCKSWGYVEFDQAR